MNTARDDAYHIQSLRSAFLREQLGGVKAYESGLFREAMVALSERGYTMGQISDLFSAAMSSKTDTSGAAHG